MNDLLNKSISKRFLEKKRGKKNHKIFYIILAIIILVVLAPIINPIRRTDEALRRYLLEITPIGTSVEEVISIVSDRKRWTIAEKQDFGVVFLAGDMSPHRGGPSEGRRVIGQQAVWVDLGTYYGIFEVYVSAFFAFDENGELIDIFIRRERDVL